MKHWLLLIFTLSLLVILAACGGNEGGTETDETPDVSPELEEDDSVIVDEEEDGQEAGVDEEYLFTTVEMMNSDGDMIGTAELTETEEGVRVLLGLQDLEPGTKAIHFHEAGQCETPDFESAGGHFNPTGASHGLDHPEGPHAGDLPNIEIGEDGTINEELIAENVSMTSGEENSLVKEGGTSIVIHESADDGVTQPSGDSGARIACGIVPEVVSLN
ncbi:MAG TPA: superoxide dismutase family protein [Planococcus sp. (in: firmicutes)]|nr:superoxide dismutase family protein [Planococcus sp. (in: firmicutes)]